MRGSRQRRMIMASRRRQFNDNQSLVGQRLIGPGEVRRARALSHLDERTKARVVAIFVVESTDLLAIDIRNNLMLRNARREIRKRTVHDLGCQLTRLSHVDELGLGFDEARPVHKLSAIRNACVGEAAREVLMSSGGVVGSIEVDANPGVAPAALGDQIAQLIEGMIDRMMDQGFGKGDDVAFWKVGGDAG